MEKLKQVIVDGEGHTIFKTDHIILALEEAGLNPVRKDDKKFPRIDISKDERKATIGLTLRPNRAPRSKYDVAEWNGNAPDGVWDLDLVHALVSLTGIPYDGGDYIGRGYQYRAYAGWLDKHFFKTEVTK